MIVFTINVKDEELLERCKDTPASEILDDFKNNSTGWMVHSDIKVNIGTRCLGCGKQLEDPDIPGFMAGAWAVMGTKGQHLGYRCHDCSIFGQKEKEI